MTYFLVNPRFPEELCRGLMPYGEVLRAPEFSALDFPISAHPDMQAANVCGNLFIHGENEALSALLESRGIAFRRISARAGRLYPADVHFVFDLEGEGFTLVSAEEFIGNSHTAITEQIFKKER